MIKYVVNKLLYGLTILWGVVTIVFFIFSFSDGDPAQMLLGERATEESKKAVEKKLGLDLPIMQQYLLYLNDLSPISFHQTESADRPNFLQQDQYSFVQLAPIGKGALVLKKPYLRRSYQSKKSVSAILSDAFVGTAVLAGAAILFALLVGGVVGIFSALYKDSFLDRSALVIAVIGMSTPSFYAAIVISWLFGFVWYYQTSLPVLPIAVAIFFVFLSFFGKKEKGFTKLAGSFFKGLLYGLIAWLAWRLIAVVFNLDQATWLDTELKLPGTYLNQSGSLYEIDTFKGPYLSLRNLILPMLTLGIRPLAIIIQLLRNSLLDVMQMDYIRTAKAKGLNIRTIVLKHALRNALNPVITAVSGWFASMLAGAVFIEFVFGWQGLGLQIYEALIKEDMPVVMGAVILISAIFVVINMLVDVLYAVIDPKIRVA